MAEPKRCNDCPGDACNWVSNGTTHADFIGILSDLRERLWELDASGIQRPKCIYLPPAEWAQWRFNAHDGPPYSGFINPAGGFTEIRPMP